MTTVEAAKKVKSMIKKDFGKSFTELKKDILSTMKYGCSDHFKSKKNGYSVFYTDNSNFMQGKSNGGGKGFYARVYFVGMCKDIKL
jgi:hypothetical protein